LAFTVQWTLFFPTITKFIVSGLVGWFAVMKLGHNLIVVGLYYLFHVIHT